MKKIFILHGWTYSIEKWEPFLEQLKKFNFEPVMLKIPGLTSKIDTAWTLDDYVEWLNEILTKEDKVILLGHSNGGRISLAYSLKYPKKISQLILIDSAGVYHNEILIQTKRILFKNLARVKSFANNTILKNILYKLAREDDYNKASQVMKKTMQNLINVDLTNQLDQIKIATIILWGEDDTITPVSDAKLIHEKIKGSKFVIIKKAKHSPMFTNGDEMVKIIIDFLNQ